MNLKDHFLIAMPSLQDQTFYHSVIYLYEHNDHGAMGVVINKPMRITLGDVLQHLTITSNDTTIKDYPVLLGGPVAPEQGFIVLPTQSFQHDEAPITSNEHVVISTSKSLLKLIADSEPAPSNDMLVTLGYAAWTTGQLEKEIVENSWLVAPFSAEILFHVPFDKRWQAAAALIGVNFDRLSGSAGHA